MKKKLQFKGVVKSTIGNAQTVRAFDNVADYNGYILNLMAHGIQFDASTEMTEPKTISFPFYGAIFDGSLESWLDGYNPDDFVLDLAKGLELRLNEIDNMSEEEKCEAFDDVDDALTVLNPQEGNDLIETFDKVDDPRMQYKYYALVNFYHTLRFALA